MQTSLEAQIASLINPTTITGPLYSAPVTGSVEVILLAEVTGSADVTGSVA
jgi:hypothetical protein